MTDTELDRTEAVEALKAASWAPEIATCGHTGCEDHRGPDEANRKIHSRSGGLGADWSLDAAIKAVTDANWVGWVQSFLGHELGVEAPNGRVVCFDVKRDWWETVRSPF
jgi:hypothetical protein